MTYHITVSKGTVTFQINAKSEEEAVKKAEKLYNKRGFTKAAFTTENLTAEGKLSTLVSKH